jgi:hypothetical protein
VLLVLKEMELIKAINFLTLTEVLQHLDSVVNEKKQKENIQTLLTVLH